MPASDQGAGKAGRQPEHGADRKIDAGRQHDQRQSGRHDEQRHRMAEHVDEVVPGQKMRREDREHDNQRRQRPEPRQDNEQSIRREPEEISPDGRLAAAAALMSSAP